MNQHRIISFGEVLWDLFPESARFGGAPANFACHAAAQGGDVTMISAVGDDDRGQEAIEILKEYGIQTDLIQISDTASTGSVGVELDDQAKPTFTIHENSAWDRVSWQSGIEDRIVNADLVYFGTLGQRNELSRTSIRRAMKMAQEAGIPRILDVNLRAPFFDPTMIRESIDHASILKLSDDELEEVCSACSVSLSGSPEESLLELLDLCQLDLVIMTRGANGALLVSPDQTYDQQGIPTAVLDTVGAGDSFTAAFATGMLRGDLYELILRNACETAAAVCAQIGAVPEPLTS